MLITRSHDVHLLSFITHCNVSQGDSFELTENINTSECNFQRNLIRVSFYSYMKIRFGR